MFRCIWALHVSFKSLDTLFLQIYNGYNNISELPTHIFDEISHFFTVYKQLEGKPTSVLEILGPEQAIQIIQESIDCYDDIFMR